MLLACYVLSVLVVCNEKAYLIWELGKPILEHVGQRNALWSVHDRSELLG